MFEVQVNKTQSIIASYYGWLIFLLCGLGATAHADELDNYAAQIDGMDGWYLTESAVVKGSDVRAGVVYAVYDTPQDHLAHILRDYGRYRELIHFISKSKIVHSESATVKHLKLKAKILKGAIKLKAKVKATEQRIDDRTLSFTLRKQSGNLKRLDAIFTVRKLSASRSLVRIEMLVDPDVWYVRNSKLSRYNKVNARRVARALKKSARDRSFRPTTGTVTKEQKPKVVEAPAPQARPTEGSAD